MARQRPSDVRTCGVISRFTVKVNVKLRRRFAGTRQSGELLTKRQIFKGHGSVSAADQADGSEEDDERRQHARSCQE